MTDRSDLWKSSGFSWGFFVMAGESGQMTTACMAYCGIMPSMRTMMNRIIHKHVTKKSYLGLPVSSERGDTIVEVLIATAIVALVLVGAYGITSHSTNAIQDSQEHQEAASLVNRQLELVRNHGGLATGSDCYNDSGVAATGAGCNYDQGGNSGCTTPPASRCYKVKVIAVRGSAAASDPTLPVTYSVKVTWDSVMSTSPVGSVGMHYKLPEPNPAYVPPPSATPVACQFPQKDITVIMDASHSMINNNYGGLGNLRAVAQRNAVQQFIGSISLSPTGNLLSIAQFNDQIVASQALTTNKTALLNASNSAPDDIYTHYGVAIDRAQSFLTGAGNRPGAPKYIIFLSDGRANDLGESNQAEIDATNAYIDAKVDALGPAFRIYSVAVDYNPNGTDALYTMPRGGGWYSNAPTEQSLIDRLQDIATELNCTTP